MANGAQPMYQSVHTSDLTLIRCPTTNRIEVVADIRRAVQRDAVADARDGLADATTILLLRAATISRIGLQRRGRNHIQRVAQAADTLLCGMAGGFRRGPCDCDGRRHGRAGLGHRHGREHENGDHDQCEDELHLLVSSHVKAPSVTLNDKEINFTDDKSMVNRRQKAGQTPLGWAQNYGARTSTRRDKPI